MALLGVQAVEVVVGQLDLRAVQNGKAHAHKDVLDLVQGQIHGVLVPDGHVLTGDGHIHRLGLQPGLQGGGLQLLAGGLDGALQGGADLVGQLAHGGALLGRQLAHLLEHGGQLALLAQILHPQGVQGGGIPGLLKGLQSLGANVR